MYIHILTGEQKKTGGSHTKEKKKTKKQIENETVRINASLALSKWAKRAEHLLLLSTLFFSLFGSVQNSRQKKNLQKIQFFFLGEYEKWKIFKNYANKKRKKCVS